MHNCTHTQDYAPLYALELLALPVTLEYQAKRSKGLNILTAAIKRGCPTVTGSSTMIHSADGSPMTDAEQLIDVVRKARATMTAEEQVGWG